MTEHTELRYPGREGLTKGEKATLTYENVYSGTVVENTVTVTDTTGHVTVETERGAEWGIFGGSVRTSVNNRRMSGTVNPKNGRTLGYLVDLEQ